MLLPEAIVTLRALAQAAEQVGEKDAATLLSATAREVETAEAGTVGRVTAGFATTLQACADANRIQAERTMARADMFARAAEALQSAAKGGA